MTYKYECSNLTRNVFLLRTLELLPLAFPLLGCSYRRLGFLLITTEASDVSDEDTFLFRKSGENVGNEKFLSGKLASKNGFRLMFYYFHKVFLYLNPRFAKFHFLLCCAFAKAMLVLWMLTARNMRK